MSMNRLPLARLFAALILAAAAPQLAACDAEHGAAATDAAGDSRDTGSAACPAPALLADLVDYSCKSADWHPGACGKGQTLIDADRGNSHVELPAAITWTDNPPSSGAHRGQWARFGEYAYLPPQRWLHNLEHGAVAFLYHPCAPREMVDALRKFAKAMPPGDAGPARWVLTPYPGLPTSVAAVTWQARYLAECLDPQDLQGFLDAHYLKAPEDVGMQGTYDWLWQAK